MNINNINIKQLKEPYFTVKFGWHPDNTYVMSYNFFNTFSTANSFLYNI